MENALTTHMQNARIGAKGGAIMAKTANLTIRIDPEIKTQADGILQYLGMTTSEAITLFLRQVVLTRGIPFPIKDPEPNAETLEAIREADEIIKSGNFRYKNAEEMFESLGI